MATSFGTQGSTPKQGLNASQAFAGGGLTPYSKALNGTSAFSSPSTIGNSGTQPTKTLSQMVQPTTINHPGLLAAANSHPTSLTTSPTGEVKATYAPPTPASKASPSSSPTPAAQPSTSSAGHTAPNPGDTTGAVGTNSNTNVPYGSQPYSSSNPPEYSGLVGAGANAAQTAAGVGAQEQKTAFDAAQANQKALVQSRLNEATVLKETAGQPIPLGDITGQQQAEANYYAQQQAGLGAGVQGEAGLAGVGNTSQGQGITGLGNSAVALAPSNRYSTLSLGQYQTDSNGNPVGGGTGQAASNAVRAGIINNGISQGTDYANRATDLSTTLSQVDQLSPKLTDFLTSNGINRQTSPWANKPINTYLAQANPAAVAGANVLFGDLKTYTAQILGDSGLTPTDVGLTNASFDPSTFTPGQLTDFIQTLRVAGQTRLAPIQQTSQNAYSAASQGAPYSGARADTALPTPVSKANQSYSTNPGVQLLGGVGGQIFGGLGGLSGIGSSALGAAGEALLSFFTKA